MSDAKILQDDRDFLVELIDWQGKPAVRKSIKPSTPAERAPRLLNEAYGLEFLADMLKRYPQVKLYVPALYESTAQYLIREYIDTEPVASREYDTEKSKKNLDELAQLLADIDAIEPYGETRFVGHFDYHDITKNFEKWTREPIRDGQMTTEQYAAVKKIVEPLLKYISPRICHGDLSPQAHCYIMLEGKIAFIDLENFTPSGARYYDVARVYVRLFSYEKTTELAKYFLASFMSKSRPVEHKDEQLMAILTARILGMQYDAWYDAGKGDDYRERAKELLSIALSADLKDLY